MLTKTQINLIKRKMVDEDNRTPVILAALGDACRYKILIFL